MPVVVQHVYIAQCPLCRWEGAPRLTESAAKADERTHLIVQHRSAL